MRTTLTLDPDVRELVEAAVAKRRETFKNVINDAIRRGLAPSAGPRKQKPYRVRPHRTTLRPGIDAEAYNQLADELEDEAVIQKIRSAR